MASAQNIILAELERQIGGVAEAAAATDSGKFQQTMNELGEAAEAAGTFILPLVSGLASGLKAIAEGFTSLPGPAQGVIIALAGCMRGMQSGRSAAAVGQAATSAVVTSIVGIIVASATLTVIYLQVW